MRRAERLFRIIQLLRDAGRVVTAGDLARALEISPRTVYRDVAHLIGSGVPIEGEAGVGYVLAEGYELPPLTFTFEQLEALAFGARAAAMLADKELAVAAREALGKIEAALPDDHAARLRAAPLYAFRPRGAAPATGRLRDLRDFVRDRRKISLSYESLREEVTLRVVRPLALINFGPVWLLTAWCELRDDFRNFRLDRILGAAATGERFADEAGKTLADYQARRAEC